MKSFAVRGISIFFSGQQPREFNLRYFTVMYFISKGKVITKNYHHNDRNVANVVKLPTHIELEESIVDCLPTGVPTAYNGPLTLTI